MTANFVSMPRGMAYIRKTYGVPARRGVRVEYTGGGYGEFGTIISAKYRLRVKLDYDGSIVHLHPTWMIRYCV